MHKFSTLFYFLSLVNVAALTAQSSLNVDLFGLINRGDTRYSGSWSYVAPDGSEYALLGAMTGTAVYPIDDPANITEVGFIPGPETRWREITVVGSHAFVVTDVMDDNHSMQVIDLSFLPDSLHLVTSYTETFTKGHIIQKDIWSDEPFVYVMGTCGSCGVHILDVSDPASPVEIGNYDPGYYIHDAHIRGDIMFAAAFSEYEMDIVDISDKTNPALIGKVTYDGQNTHSSSLSEDGKYLFIADESDGIPMHVVNVEDVENPFEVAHFTANEASLVHNPYVRGDFCFLSHNTEGLRVLDIADPTVPVEVGFYDTYDGPSGGFSGLWSACPYFPSGKIIGGDRHEGLYIWTFEETRAARVYGIVTDSLTGEILWNTEIEIPELSRFLHTDLDGSFKTGMLPGSYTLIVDSSGYLPKTIELELTESDSVWVEIQLVSEDYSALHLANQNVPELHIFPNPTSGGFSIKTTNIKGASQINIYGQTGRLAFLQNIENQNLVKIETHLPTGKYRVEVADEPGNILAVGSVIVR